MSSVVVSSQKLFGSSHPASGALGSGDGLGFLVLWPESLVWELDLLSVRLGSSVLESDSLFWVLGLLLEVLDFL